MQKELLDQPYIPFDHIRQNLRELEIINSRLGGHRITLKGFRKILAATSRLTGLHIAEIGCGGGDNLKALARYCHRKKIPATFTGIDMNRECIGYARENCADFQNIQFVVGDYAAVDFAENKPALLFSSLFCHHFSDRQLVKMLQWMRANCHGGFFINDLHRHAVAYLSIWVLTRLFSRSYLVKNDAPLSVLRSFRRREWNRLFREAGVKEYDISWEWAFRYLIISIKKGGDEV